MSSGRTPASYKVMLDEVEKVRHRFNARVTNEIDLGLAFDGLDLLRAARAKSGEEILEEYSDSVFAYAFDDGPKEGESKKDWTIRLCQERPINGCIGQVPEVHADILVHRATASLVSKARSTLRECQRCGPKFRAHLQDSVALKQSLQERAQKARELGSPGRWPIALVDAEKWNKELNLVFLSERGDYSLNGKVIWRGLKKVPRSTKNEELLGVHLLPEQRISDLRNVLKIAKRKKYSGLALQVRKPKYPYELGSLLINDKIMRKQVTLPPSASVQAMVGEVTASGSSVRQ